MKYLTVLSGFLYRFCVLAMVASLIAMLVCVITQVVLRTFFKTTFLPFEDLVVYTFTVSIFMGIAVVFRTNGHLATPMLVDLCPPGLQRVIAVSMWAIVAVFLLVLLVCGGQYVADSFSSYSPSLNIPMGWIFLSIPVSAACSLVFLIEHACTGLNVKPDVLQ